MRTAVLLVLLVSAWWSSIAAREQVYLDSRGVIRWSADDREVALFGANYGLPSASDYRAAGYVGADRRRLIERDVAHFARMGWDGLRLALWGDWENSDRVGNLVVNEHLELMDYLIHQAKLRGISMLFSPIHTHSALWPDGGDGPSTQGFSRHFSREQMGRDPAAIAAQANYLRQILSHVNPFTGVALKDEPGIVCIELINEPWHHADDPTGSVAYINALVDAARSIGCEKIIVHNLSQDFAIAGAIRESRAQGVSFAWYPTGLLAGRTLTDNFLRWVDDYPPMDDPQIAMMPRIVYEFDAADTLSPAMYPAMVRTFRGAGAQFAAMFAYDMLDTAPYNLGWQTHYLNLVYTPGKALGAIIAGEAMRRLPRGARFGPYPGNCRFGPFGVSPEGEGRAWMVAPDAFLHAGGCSDITVDPEGLDRIAGVGRSSLVEYEGTGAYFLDRITPGVWRLEVYPDAVLVQDPFSQRLNHQTVSSRLVWRTWPMCIRLPDLGGSFALEPLNAGNRFRARAVEQRAEVRPGVYLLTREGVSLPTTLPERIGHVGFTEFVCPQAPDLPPQIVPHVRDEYVVTGIDSMEPWEADVVSSETPERVELHIRRVGEKTWQVVEMRHVSGFRYRAHVQAKPGRLAWFIEAHSNGERVCVPAARGEQVTTRIVAPSAPLVVFAPARDFERMYTERHDDARESWPLSFQPAGGGAGPRLRFSGVDSGVRMGLSIREAVSGRGDHAARLDSLRIRARASTSGRRVTLVLIEVDGTSWSAPIELSSEMREHVVGVDSLRTGGGTKLPVGYPGCWNTSLPPAAGRGGGGDRVRIADLQHVQIVFEAGESGGTIDIEAIALAVEGSGSMDAGEGAPALR